ncbi:hypothetical protein YB2330_003700 [Saitoella coloradoensis]
MNDYERQRLANIAKNRALLAELGLERPAPAPATIAPARAPKPRFASIRKRKVSPALTEKTVDTEADDTTSADSRRKSRRLSKAPARYIEEPDDQSFKPNTTEMDSDDLSSDGEHPRSRGSRPGKTRPTGTNPNTFGAIPGVPVGMIFKTRQEASYWGIHAPWVSGISGNTTDGCHSIALSGGYEDDVDEGFRFTYTGSGGRDLKGTAKNPKNLRTAPQTSDQSFDHRYNQMLKISCDTERPVRVLRGFKGHSEWAPIEGYRYDGLYTCLKAWREEGMSGFLVCKYAFKRCDGQPPLLTRGEIEKLETSTNAVTTRDAESTGDAEQDVTQPSAERKPVEDAPSKENAEPTEVAQPEVTEPEN